MIPTPVTAELEADIYVTPLTPMWRRCPDFDEGCAAIKNKHKCFEGGVVRGKHGALIEMSMADGYCPHLIGMLPQR